MNGFCAYLIYLKLITMRYLSMFCIDRKRIMVYNKIVIGNMNIENCGAEKYVSADVRNFCAETKKLSQ